MSFDERWWLDRFKDRHDISFKRICGEENSIDTGNTCGSAPTKLTFFSVKCAAMISSFSYLYALVYGDINLFCLMFAYFILLCN